MKAEAKTPADVLKLIKNIGEEITVSRHGFTLTPGTRGGRDMIAFPKWVMEDIEEALAKHGS